VLIAMPLPSSKPAVVVTGLKNPDFNLTINTVPRGDEDMEYFLWHMQILPRVNPADCAT
jgi:hypothetical protein